MTRDITGYIKVKVVGNNNIPKDDAILTLKVQDQDMVVEEQMLMENICLELSKYFSLIEL
jgi:hypothetical protein